MTKASEQIEAILPLLKADEEKFAKGNSSAGVRVRKSLQAIKKICQDGRQAVTEAKKAA